MDTTVVPLSDGSGMLVRPLTAADRDGYVAALDRLSAHSRYLRFAAPKPRFTRREIDYLTAVDGVQHVALVGMATVDCRGIAVARYVQTGGGAAEAAVAVVDEWQGRGVGSSLVTVLLEHARSAGLTSIDAHVLSENHASLALLRRFGFHSTGHAGSERSYRLALDARVRGGRLSPTRRGPRSRGALGHGCLSGPRQAVAATCSSA